MQLHFAGKNIEITPALKDFATEKLQALEKRFNSISKINVTLHVEHIAHIAEGTVFLKDIEIHASASDDDMYKAIAAIVEKLFPQIEQTSGQINRQSSLI